MVVGMLAAFIGAGLADLGAQAADGRRMRTLARHCGHGQFADPGALQVLGNAGGHHPDVCFLQAGSRAGIAGNDAGLAGVHAGLVVDGR